MKRRILLRWSGLTSFGFASGCLEASDSGDTAGTSSNNETETLGLDESDEDDDVTDEENDSIRLNSSGENGANNSVVDEGAGGYDESRQDPIFVGNTTDSELTVQLTLVSESDDEMIISGEHTIPERKGIEIPEITDVGKEYEITVE